MHQEREYPGRVSGTRPVQPRLRRAGARLRLVRGERVDATAAVRAGAARGARRRRPALIHLKLDADVITSRTTLSAIRKKAEARRGVKPA